jgi:predicted membrane-bound dolichyl-phosphate-mannose-protein mannosyltransferase
MIQTASHNPPAQLHFEAPSKVLQLSVGRRLAVGSCLIALAISVVLAAASDGSHHDDDLAHFLYARWSGEHPKYLLHEWARPGFTVLYALPAQLGWVAARWLSGLLTVAAAWLAYRCAEEIRLPHAWIVAPLALIQPMFLQLSYTTLTETPLAFFLMLAMWLLLSRRFGLSAVALSAALVTRHEAVVWLPIWVIAMWHGRARWWSYPLLLWAPVLQNALSPFVIGKMPILLFLEPTADVHYGHGSAMAMVGRAVVAYGPGMAAMSCLGVVSVWRKRRGWIVASSAIVYFAFHVICRYLGVYATGGYPRFLVPICPLVAILVAAAILALAEWSSPRWWLRATAVAAGSIRRFCWGSAS